MFRSSAYQKVSVKWNAPDLVSRQCFGQACTVYRTPSVSSKFCWNVWSAARKLRGGAQVEKTKSIQEAMARQTEEIKKQAKIVKTDLDFLDALNERVIQQPVHPPSSHAVPACSRTNLRTARCFPLHACATSLSVPSTFRQYCYVDSLCCTWRAACGFQQIRCMIAVHVR
jgi:hypothetical protein